MHVNFNTNTFQIRKSIQTTDIVVAKRLIVPIQPLNTTNGPDALQTGQIAYNSVNNILNYSSGGAWIPLATGSILGLEAGTNIMITTSASGTFYTISSTASGPNVVQQQTFATVGATTFIIPANAINPVISAVAGGGGGGGGGGNSTYASAGGGGGGVGGMIINMPLQAGASITINIAVGGASGAGGNNGDGDNGGGGSETIIYYTANSSVQLILNGGNGGVKGQQGSLGGASGGAGGSGGTVSASASHNATNYTGFTGPTGGVGGGDTVNGSDGDAFAFGPFGPFSGGPHGNTVGEGGSGAGGGSSIFAQGGTGGGGGANTQPGGTAPALSITQYGCGGGGGGGAGTGGNGGAGATGGQGYAIITWS
jgi:hypothetical protein